MNDGKETMKLELVRIPKWEREHRDILETLEFELSRLKREPNMEGKAESIALIESKLKAEKAKIATLNVAIGAGHISRFQVGAVIEFNKLIAEHYLAADDRRVAKAKEELKDLKAKLKRFEKADDTPLKKGAIQRVQQRIKDLGGDDDGAEKLRMFKVVKEKKPNTSGGT
jgi:hypothetical protein